MDTNRPRLKDGVEGLRDKRLYSMETYAHGHPAVYTAESWLGLGWSIFKHRLWHLLRDRRWMD